MANVKSDSQNYTAIAETVRELTLSDDKYTPAQMPDGVEHVYDAACSAFGCKESGRGVDSLVVDYVNPAEHIVPVKLSSKNLIKLEAGKSVGLNDGIISYSDPSNARAAASQLIPIDKDTIYYLSGDGVAQARVSLYDEELNFIGRTSQGAFTGTEIYMNKCTLGNGTKEYDKGKYIIVMVWATDYAPLSHNVQLELGSAVTGYTEHIENFSNLTLTAKSTKTTVNEYIALPSEYQQVDYIESTGTQYIDTGFIPNDSSGFDIVYLTKSAVATSNYGTILGTRYNSRNTEFHLTTFNGELRFANNTYNNGIIANELMHSTLKNKEYTNNNGATASLSGEFVAPGNLTVFALNVRGSITQYSKTRVYSLKLYDGDTLVRDYVPCYKKDDGVSGLFDLVNNEFYTNKRTTGDDFIKGETVAEPVKHTYSVNEDGTVDGVKSIWPSMTLSSDTEGAVIEAKYFVDGQAKIQALTDTIISLGGEL